MSVIEFRPSRLLAMLLVALHLAAAFSFLSGFGVGFASAAGLVLLGGTGWHCWRHGRCGARCSLGLLEDGALIVDPGGPAECRLDLLPASVVTYPVVWLIWRADGSRKSGASMLLRDQFAPHEWSVLQVWLRLRVRTSLDPQVRP